MNIGIVGQGYVGTAIKVGFEPYYDLETYDKYDEKKSTCDLADLVIVTEDNPRLEDAAFIRKGVLSGCDMTKVIEIANRKEAIKQAVTMLQPEDVLILAGKGHEKYQIIGNERFDFDEEKIVQDAIR